MYHFCLLDKIMEKLCLAWLLLMAFVNQNNERIGCIDFNLLYINTKILIVSLVGDIVVLKVVS
jgi:hypothetical protein